MHNFVLYPLCVFKFQIVTLTNHTKGKISVVWMGSKLLIFFPELQNLHSIPSISITVCITVLTPSWDSVRKKIKGVNMLLSTPKRRMSNLELEMSQLKIISQST